MKTLLTTLNSQYVHSNLALKYLYTVVADTRSDVEVREFTINNDPNYIYTEIMRANYDMVCFSCYIWNIEQTKRIAADLKLADPELKIVLGGPEVSFCAPELMQKNYWIDYILSGEGEYSFYRLMELIQAGNYDMFATVPGLSYREDGVIYVNPEIEPMDMNAIPFPYSILNVDDDRVVYYESTRGCPFNCSYCLSSIDRSMRILDIERVKAEIKYFLYRNVMQVKFIDRTFNFDKNRAYEIIKYIIENDNGKTNFHFEICAELLDDRTIELLGKARKGLFQLEIGIQSANPDTLKAINRNENVYPVLYNVERLVALGNVHIHVDLIAGLPYETYELFERSFDKVYNLNADAFQMGFLKVLKGTPIEVQVMDHGIVYRQHAPYEVISTDYISAAEMTTLKMIENMLDIFYNRKGFKYTLGVLLSKYTPFNLYETLADFYYKNGYQNKSRKKDDQYRILRKFAIDKNIDIEEAITKDASENMDELNYKRFLNKGWEI